MDGWAVKRLTDLDRIDAAIAGLEGGAVAVVGDAGLALCPDGTPYQPTRQREEAMRLLEKYVIRLVPGRAVGVRSDDRQDRDFYLGLQILR